MASCFLTEISEGSEYKNTFSVESLKIILIFMNQKALTYNTTYKRCNRSAVPKIFFGNSSSWLFERSLYIKVH